jgi:hypothetical protein
MNLKSKLWQESIDYIANYQFEYYFNTVFISDLSATGLTGLAR